jgi:catechol 2,3-dioxygenase-like lactoylglutathione lyase family enzyme
MPLRYTGIRITDLKRSHRFYTKVLGLREVRRGDLRKFGLGIWVLLQDPRSKQRLELNWYPPRTDYGSRYVPGEGLDHIGFFLGKVPRKALENEYRRLLKGGARPTAMTPKVTEGWMFDVKDPDGNWIEVFRYPTVEENRKARAEEAKKVRKKRSQRR